ncbi:flavin reductase family protein [Fluoribacter gormanii]|uniref:flavin reductase family protein n=1 Tax=Fluoribacter gormanii TaxID=464 RepID=UPI002243D441|nr:flavin reductase family protein [Fluoribacter gormanii]MCW8469904.1 flavin reductase family protein [Fluoribacter gormanii]MCW8470494.1 flavin reductase family protein [Fluoribacter gormanii]
MFFHTSQKLPKGLFKACVVPRPIAWISTNDIDGNPNLAPFSYFNIVCEDPPMIMFATTGSHGNGGAKDTLKNVEETKEFTVNLVSYSSKEAMNITSLDFSRGINEFHMAEVDHLPGELIQTYRVNGSPISLECVYHRSIQLPTSNDSSLINRMVIGKVVGIHLNPDILTKDKRIDTNKLNVIARVGYNAYTKVKAHFELNRPCGCCDKLMD